MLNLNPVARKIHRNDSRMSHNHFRGNVEPRMTHFEIDYSFRYPKMYRSKSFLLKKWKIEKFTFVRRKSTQGRPPAPFGLRDGELTVLNEKVALYQRKSNERPLISPEIEHLRGVFAIYKPPHTGNYFKYFF